MKQTRKLNFTRYDKAAETFLRTYLLNILWRIKINNNDSIKSLERLLLAGAGDKTAGLSIAKKHFPFIILHLFSSPFRRGTSLKIIFRRLKKHLYFNLRRLASSFHFRTREPKEIMCSISFLSLFLSYFHLFAFSLSVPA